jgi:ABC-type multidrug transport system fused ATPase/permease subunit
VLVSMFVLRGIGTFATAYYNNWVLSRVTNDLRAQAFERLLRLPVARFHEESTGKVINTVVGDVRQVVDMIQSVFVACVRDTLVVIGLLAYLLWLNWKLTLAAIVVVPLTAVIVRTTSKRLRHLNRENQRVTAEMTQVVEEAARGHQVIRVFSGERYENRRFFLRSEALRGFSQRMTVAFAATTPVTQVATSLALSLVVVLALRAGLTPGEFTLRHPDADAADAAEGAGRGQRPDAARDRRRRNRVRADRRAGRARPRHRHARPRAGDRCASSASPSVIRTRWRRRWTKSRSTSNPARPWPWSACRAAASRPS